MSPSAGVARSSSGAGLFIINDAAVGVYVYFLSVEGKRPYATEFKILRAEVVVARSLQRTNSRPRGADDATSAGARCTARSAPVSPVARRSPCLQSVPRRVPFPG